MQSKVSLVKSKGHYKGVKDSLKPFQSSLSDCLSDISELVIKINLVITRTPAYSKGVELATTPLDSVRGFIDFVSPFYKGKIVIAEESTWGDTKEGFEMYGFTKLANDNPQVELLDSSDDEVIMEKIIYPGGELNLSFSKTMVESQFLVSIARPKTHCTVGVTAGIKNVLVGAIQKYKMRRSIHRGKHIHDIIASISDVVYPDFVIIDGTDGMEGGGPIRGDRVESHWALSSFDPLAADSVTTFLMGFKADDVGYVKLLREKSKGYLYPDKNIEVIGQDPADLVVKFKPHRNFK
jgi:uncharacterized protein (DUF362 family)